PASYHVIGFASYQFRRALERVAKFRPRDKELPYKSRWSRTVIDHKLVSRDLHREKVQVGDEHGVQSRFQQSVGQMVGEALEAQHIDISFRDFKTSGVAYNNVPDVALIATNPSIHPKPKAIGELLAQPIQYMVKLDAKYGWIPTYDESIFIRQVYDNNSWRIEYSPVIADYLVCHVIMIEAKQVGGDGHGQPLAYMAMVQANRKKRGQSDWTVYGVLSDGEIFTFYHLDMKSQFTLAFLQVQCEGWQKIANMLASFILEGMKTCASPIRSSLASDPSPRNSHQQPSPKLPPLDTLPSIEDMMEMGME
ncbi:hypothetical protein N7516_005526, partial [Penicillium verrucosum]|uniref:uncharacterized protein n=1 Tax=Penicillium verrucosum TaxID=60171 RepID=UPI0025454DF6